MNIEWFECPSDIEARLPWRKYPGILVSRAQLEEVLARCETHGDHEGATDVATFLRHHINIMDEPQGSVLRQLSPEPGWAAAIRPWQLARTRHELAAVVHLDTLAHLRCCLIEPELPGLRAMLRRWEPIG